MSDPAPDEEQLLAELEEEFADDPEFTALSREEKRHLLRVMEKMLEMGVGAVYGEEPEGVPESDVPCGQYLSRCHARCCGYQFALTREEAASGLYRHNPQRPFFMARDADGLCSHLDRATLRCTIWERRPLRCRRYDCRQDPGAWPDGGGPAAP